MTTNNSSKIDVNKQFGNSSSGKNVLNAISNWFKTAFGSSSKEGARDWDSSCTIAKADRVGHDL